MEFTVYDIALVPVIIALVGIFGKMGLSPRYQPAAALLLGLAGGFMYLAPDDPKKAILMGLVMGLTAIGTYSGVKNSFQNRDES